MLFRKTLLALAVTASAVPAFAQTVQLTNAGFLSERQTYTEDLEITGSYTGGSDEDAIELNGSTLQKNLILNATINSTGDFAGGVDMDSMKTVWSGSTTGSRAMSSTRAASAPSAAVPMP